MGAACWIGLFLTVTLTIDPYGVSPLHVTLRGINQPKPRRLDIDRLIKPYEVWRYQPRTVFLGTSRIHESIDPAMLDGTRLVPAYNSSIPASTLVENATHLEQFFTLDPSVKVVFVELFFYAFTPPQSPTTNRTTLDTMGTSAPLFFSADTAFDTLRTVFYNATHRSGSPSVGPGGNWLRPAEWLIGDSFKRSVFVENVLASHRDQPRFIMQPEAFAALDRIVALCREHDAELYLLVTPTYIWDDYRAVSLGFWDDIADWLRRVSTYPNVLSFSQHNAVSEEPPSDGMRWWYDPLHFSPNTGRLMLHAVLGAPDPETPPNFVRAVAPANVESIIAERRLEVERWAERNPEFVSAFERAKSTPRGPSQSRP